MESSYTDTVYQAIVALAEALGNVSESYLIKVLLDAHIITKHETKLLETHHRSITTP